MTRCLTRRWLLVWILATGAGGCRPAAAEVALPPPPEVEFSLPVVREVVDHEEFTGRVEAVNSVQVQARVSGYLEKVHFQEGAEIQKGDVLYQIDRRPYQAQLEEDQADLTTKKALLVLKTSNYQRVESTLNRGAVTQQEFDIARGEYQVARAAVQQAEARLKATRLKLEWTRVTASVSGRIGRSRVTAGNLVVGDQTVLTSIVSLDPVHVLFSVDERTLLRLRKQPEATTEAAGQQSATTVEMGLAYEEGYSLKGTLDFEDNRIDSGTGTLLLRAVFANPCTPAGGRLLSPGLFARVRLPVGTPRQALLIADRALGADQGKKVLWVVGDRRDPVTKKVQLVVERRYVHPGGLHGGLREIQGKLQGVPLPAHQTVAATDGVIVSGLQRIRPGMVVRPLEVEMPGVAPARVIATQPPADRSTGGGAGD